MGGETRGMGASKAGGRKGGFATKSLTSAPAQASAGPGDAVSGNAEIQAQRRQQRRKGLFANTTAAPVISSTTGGSGPGSPILG